MNSVISFCGLLTILFIGLKLTNHIDWSWWWVVSPLWGPVALILGCLLVMGAMLLIGVLFVAVMERKSSAPKIKDANYKVIDQ